MNRSAFPSKMRLRFQKLSRGNGDLPDILQHRLIAKLATVLILSDCDAVYFWSAMMLVVRCFYFFVNF